MKNTFRQTISLVFTFSAFIAIILPQIVIADVYVNGYYRKNGTYVQPHYRSNPDGNPYNNWSYPGNTNPYTGETTGGNPDTYLNNYYNNSESYYGSNLYNYSGDTSANSAYETVDRGYKSYGVLFCDYGYQKYNDTCIKTLNNATYNGSSWLCNYGYYQSNDECVVAPTNSSTNGISWWCNNDYTPYGDLCIRSIPNAHIKNGGWVCDDSFYAVGDICISIDQICKNNYGQSAYGVGKDCYCKNGFEWSTVEPKSCVLKPPSIDTFNFNNAPLNSSYSINNTTATSAKNKNVVENDIDTKYKFSTNLRFGSNGDDVSHLQTFLEKNGLLKMPSGSKKGYFGKATQDALKKYQISVDIPGTGFFGAQTRGKINTE